MKIVDNKSNILIIPGYLKNEHDFDKIHIDKNLVILEQNDYLKPISDVVTEIHSQIISRDLIVAHSVGCFYALKLANLFPHLYKKLLLIDPPVKCAQYYDYLKEKYPNRLTYYDELPDHSNINSKTIIQVHYNYTKNNDYKIPYLYKLVNKNICSRLILHDNIGHMIHQKKPEVILDSIKNM